MNDSRQRRPARRPPLLGRLGVVLGICYLAAMTVWLLVLEHRHHTGSTEWSAVLALIIVPLLAVEFWRRARKP